MLKVICLLFMMYGGVFNCQAGCLLCRVSADSGSVKRCHLCDALNQFTLRDGACVKSTQTKCGQLGDNDTCLHCNSGFVINAGKCVAVEQAKQIQNCLDYDNATLNCLTCQPSFYLDQNQCKTVTTRIANCQLYMPSQTCLTCEEGYYASADFTRCLESPVNSNCLFHQSYDCNSCAAGHTLTKNFLKTDSQRLPVNQEERSMFNTIIQLSQTKYSIAYDAPFCVPNTVQNCAVLNDFANCKTCAPGNYLDNANQCIKNPVSVISNCVTYIYSSVAPFYTCKTCELGYKESSGKCLKIDNVANCIKMIDATSQCTECSSTHYLSQNTCILRTLTQIDQCKTYDLTADRCSACESLKVLSQDGLLCLHLIAECVAYENFTQSTSQDRLLCKQCSDLFYLAVDKKSCLFGTGMNCMKYRINENVCEKCVNQYYTAPSCEFKHNSIPDCTTYSETNERFCSKCGEGWDFYNQRILNRCVASKIDNCVEYEGDIVGSSRKCKACATGYYLSNGSLNCTQNREGCSLQPAGTCTVVGYGFYRPNGVQLVPYNDFLMNNCDKVFQGSDDGDNARGAYCVKCKNDFLMLNTSFNYCYDKTTWQTKTGYTIPQSCMVVDEANICHQCIDGFNLSSANTPVCQAFANNAIYRCPGTEVLNLIHRHQTSDLTPHINKCTAQANAGDQVAVQIKYYQSVFKLKCLSGAFQMDLGGDAFRHPYTFDDKTLTYIFNSEEHVIDCRVNAAPLTHVNDTALPDNAEQSGYFQEVSGQVNQIRRVGCEQNFAGKITRTLPTTGIIFISPCTQVGNSPPYSFSYSGSYFPEFRKLYQYFSINKCSGTNELLVNFMNVVYNVNVSTSQFEYANYSKTKPATERPLETSTAVFSNVDQYACIDVTSFDTIKSSSGFKVSSANDAASSLSSVNEGVDYVSMQNCALAVWNVGVRNNAFRNDYKLESNIGAMTLICISCKPGFKYNYNTATCDSILNCSSTDLGKTMNKCKKCSANYVLNEAGNECIAVPDSLKEKFMGCLVGASSINSIRCIYCDDQHTWLEGGFCGKLTELPAGSTYVQRTSWDYLNGANDAVYPFTENTKVNSSNQLIYQIQNYLGGHQPQRGFATCAANSFLIQQVAHASAPTRRFSCLKHAQFVSDNYTFGLENKLPTGNPYNQSGFILNCTKIRLTDGNYRCSDCREGYVENGTKEYCYPRLSSQPKCKRLFGNENSRCDKCDDNYFLNSVYDCVEIGKIAKCKEYSADLTKINIAAQCSQCDDKYFLKSDNTCSEGGIHKCLVYESSTKCSQCEVGFLPMCSGSNCNTSVSCIKANIPFCEKQASHLINNIFQFGCTKCLHDYAFEATTSVDIKDQSNQYSFCDKHDESIPNCESYEALFFTSSIALTCTKCKATHFLVNNTCQLRTRIQIQFCQEDHWYMDACWKCSAGYYLNDLRTTCIAQPTGKYQCISFDRNLKCLECGNYHILNSDGVCVQVTNLRLNCEKYSSDQLCLVCESGFFLHRLSNSCLEIDINIRSNCMDYESPTSCRKCKDNHVRKVTGGEGFCDDIRKDFLKCASINVDVVPPLCRTCEVGFYPTQAGQCSSVVNSITGCLIYESSSTCRVCSPGTALSFDRTKCLSISENTCLDAFIPESQVCHTCRSGYVIVNGKCVLNSNTIETSLCFDERLNGTCNFCKPGTYMNLEEKCVGPAAPVIMSAVIFVFMNWILFYLL